MLIVDERELVESIIASKEKPPKMGMRSFIRYLAMYYYDEYGSLPLASYIGFIQNKIKTFSFPLYVYEESRFYNYLFKTCSKIKSGTMNHKLRDSAPVVITKEEMKIISLAPTEKHRKLLFTLYVLAKKVIPSTGWVNFSLRDIFAFANVYVNQNQKYEMIYDLNQLKLIEVNHIIDKQGYKVNLIEDSPPAIAISDFRSLGNQYLGKTKDGWIDCEICHRMVKIKSKYDHSRKYCRTCAEEVDRVKARIRMSNIRDDVRKP